MSKKKLSHTTALVLFIIGLWAVGSMYGQGTMNVYQENFESGQGNWFADNGVWEIGKPTVGPDSLHSPQNCAATILVGNYPSNANSRLISPRISLPLLSPGEKLRLYIWHWFRMNEDDYYGPDEGRIQISINNEPWKDLFGPFSGLSPIWTQVCVDISQHAGKSIRIAFYLTSTWRAEDNGWYIDDISIKKGPVQFANPEGFENGVGDWSADNGLWQIGKPASGPNGAYSGQSVAGVVLKGNYLPNANTRLISPPINLPTTSANEKLQLRFWHWFLMNEDDYYGPDNGYVQISENDGPWQTIAGPYSGISAVWTQPCVDLSIFAGKTVRLAFYFGSTWRAEANGWYIDDVLIKKVPIYIGLKEDFEHGNGDWCVDNGVWEIGKPMIGPAKPHQGDGCAGVVLKGNYPPNANTRLISPEVKLILKPNESPALFFWHWFRMNEDDYYGPDQGWVQISANGGPWKTIAGPFSGISTTWTQTFADLSAYADSTIRLAFYFGSTWRAEDNGWYIDDVRIDGVVVTDVGESSETQDDAKTFALHQNYPNPFNPETAILYELPRTSQVEVTIFNLIGEKIRTLVNQSQQAGQHRLLWNGRNENEKLVPSGVYFYRLRAGEFVQTRKMVLMQ